MKRFKKMLPALSAVLTAGMLFLVSLDFYGSQEYSVLQSVLLAVINSIRAFTFDPSVSPEELMEVYRETGSEIHRILMYVYPVLLLAAEILVSWAVVQSLIVLLKLGRKKSFLKRGRKDILVFGLNSSVKELLEDNETWQIHLFCEEQPGDEERLELEEMYADCGVDWQWGDFRDEERMFRILCRILKHAKALPVIFLENSSSKNFENYMMFGQLGRRLEKSVRERVKCYISCESETVEELIYDYYDHQPEEERLEIKLFNISKLRIRDMFAAHPVTKVVQEQMETMLNGSLEERMEAYCSGAEKFRQHILIAGFGVIGQEALLQALNLSVVHSEAEILIDVADREAEARSNAFMSRFERSYLRKNVQDAGWDGGRTWKEYELEKPRCDGRLRIRFFHEDIVGEGFKELLLRITEVPENAWADQNLKAENPLTYAVVSVTDPDVSLHGMLEIRNCVARYQEQTRIPIGVRVDEDEHIARFLNQNGKYEEVFPISLSENVVRIGQILDEKAERTAIEYNDCYDQLSGGASHEKLQRYRKREFSVIEKNWKKLVSYKRRSSRYMGYHAAMKNFLADRILGEEGFALIRENYPGIDALDAVLRKERPDNVQERFLVEMARLEHRRWCCFMAMNGWSSHMKWEELSETEVLPASDQTLQTHPCLCCWQILKEFEGDKMIYDLIPFIISIYGRESKEPEKAGTESEGVN